MNTVAFLSRLIGPLFIVIALGLILSTQDYQKMFKEAMKSPFVLYISGLIAYSLGMIVILKHNIWGWNADGIVTLAGYAALVKGILLLLSPKWLMRMSTGMVESTNCLRGMGVVLLFAGTYLSYIGFIA